MIFNIKFASALLVALQCSALVLAAPTPQNAAPAKASTPAASCPVTKTLTGKETSCEDIAKEFGTDVATLVKLNVGKAEVCADLKAGKIKPAELKDRKVCVPK